MTAASFPDLRAAPPRLGPPRVGVSALNADNADSERCPRPSRVPRLASRSLLKSARIVLLSPALTLALNLLTLLPQVAIPALPQVPATECVTTKPSMPARDPTRLINKAFEKIKNVSPVCLSRPAHSHPHYSLPRLGANVALLQPAESRSLARKQPCGS